MKILRPLLLASLLLALTACVSAPPFTSTSLEVSSSPRSVLASSNFPTGQRVVWGGVIAGLEQLGDRSRLTVLAYPLDSRLYPRLDELATGRFIADFPVPIEPEAYSPNRLVTIKGVLKGLVKRVAGNAVHRYPVVEVEASHLWQRNVDGTWWERIHIGIGINISN